jgi:histidinol-phosphate aminotransferase
VHRYPDATSRRSRKLLAELHGLDASQVAVSHGAEGMLQNLGKCFLDEGDEVIRSGVTYGLYKDIFPPHGGPGGGSPVRNWRVDPDAMADAVTAKTKLVWISNPNNPLGSLCDREAFERLLERTAGNGLGDSRRGLRGVRAAGGTPRQSTASSGKTKPLIVVRNFSKYYGLAGARIGYALASADVVTAIDTVSEPFNANRIALAGAVALLRYGKASLRRRGSAFSPTGNGCNAHWRNEGVSCALPGDFRLCGTHPTTVELLPRSCFCRESSSAPVRDGDFRVRYASPWGPRRRWTVFFGLRRSGVRAH